MVVMRSFGSGARRLLHSMLDINKSVVGIYDC